MVTGRFAPSPTGRLHVGNLRTGLVAWLSARGRGSTFLVRFEDLDSGAVRDEHYRSQLDDLRAFGLDWDGPVVRQSDRRPRYTEALDRLVADDLVYPCFCSRREIREAARAPNLAHAGHHYPGTCRHLSSAQRTERSLTRDPALRLRAGSAMRAFDDLVMGSCRFDIDDFVVRRNDGTPAYHLVVVVDDAEQGVDLVVRADDLLESTSRHLLLYELLGLAPPNHAHVPLVLAPNGDRLAKRHGAVNLDDRAELGEPPLQVMAFLASTLGLCTPEEAGGGDLRPTDLIDRFDFARLPHEPLTLPAHYLARSTDRDVK
ncbi:MAG: tRNA glutamyl-Q(34) synthetase GluQRS [Acidimicrobiales bacterium]